jgi:S-adenosylmethionine synthetase
MINNFKLYTVESVTSGHPDKICDQISDAILDKCLDKDPKSRVAAECLGSHGLLIIGGEITSNAQIDFEKIASQIYTDIGYSNPSDDGLKIITHITQQSPDIAQGVNTGGAGDQGIMYGYATNETEEFLQKGIVLVHKLTKGLEHLRKSKELPWLRPDGKAQITINKNSIKTILVSTQHDEKISQSEIHKALIEKLISPLLENISDVEILINPTGKFVQGGFEADAGLTGRKIMVDTYGGLVPHGGGCFSGKDPTKVDRSGAYMARFAAKNIVAAGIAKKCLVSVAYAIGQAEPIMIEAADENGKNLDSIVKTKFDFRPQAIIERLDLQKPIYQKTATYGHFGKDGLPWEEIIENF